LSSLLEFVRGIFDKDTLTQLDDLLIEPATSVQVGQLMNTKIGTGEKVALFTDEMRDTLNSRLSLMEIKV